MWILIAVATVLAGFAIYKERSLAALAVFLLGVALIAEHGRPW